MIALIAILLVLVCDIVQRVAGDARASKLRDQQSRLKAEAAHLNKQAERLSSPASFAQSAKLTRKAVAKEKEAATLQAQEEAISGGRWVKAAQYTKTAVSLTLLLCLWGRPAVFVEPEALWPFSSLLGRTHPTGLVGLSVVPFMAISRRASSALAAALVPL
ncbi:hypothetical protein COCOBI_12-2460 [Coccomyxa sp. Obi]|nr:hypothetical protein COCOBI_12-2460 [Coccomyxa sp. Obi]